MLCVISHLGKPKAFPQAAYMNADSKHKQESRSERRLRCPAKGLWSTQRSLRRRVEKATGKLLTFTIFSLENE